MAITNIPRSFQFWNNIAATPNDFNLNAGWYGLAVHATAGFAGVALRKLLPDGLTYVTVSAAFAADGYQVLILPAGQYQMTLTGVTGFIAEIALITRVPARS